MWKKIKLICISIAAGAVAVLAIIFGSRSNGRGVSGTDQLNRDITDGLERVSGQIDGARSDIGQGRQTTGDVRRGIGKTETKLQNAMEILRKAKERTNVD